MDSLLDLDLDLETLPDNTESDEVLYDKSVSVIKEAMETVLQEILVTLPDSTVHMVYITKFDVVKNKVTYEFSTPSKDRKDELAVHVDKCLGLQMAQYKKPERRIKF